jgi:uncharacterized membrane protein
MHMQGFVSLMAIYTAFAGVLTTFTFKGPTVAPKSPSRFTVSVSQMQS